MSKSSFTAIKTEDKKSFIWIQTADGSIQQIEEEVAKFCPMIYREVLQKGLGFSKSNPISLPKQVRPSILGSIFEYCRFHQVPGRSDKERKCFNEKLIRTDANRLCEMISTAYCLELRPLVDLTSWAVARIMRGRSTEEIRDIFHVRDDLTEEEKLEPLENPTNHPYIRLLNQHLARKRKSLKEQNELKIKEGATRREDNRSVDELLELINAKDGADKKCVKPSKLKKKNKRKKNQTKDSSGNGLNNAVGKDSAKCPKICSENVTLSPNMKKASEGDPEDSFHTITEIEDDLDEEKMKENDSSRTCTQAVPSTSNKILSSQHICMQVS